MFFFSQCFYVVRLLKKKKWQFFFLLLVKHFIFFYLSWRFLSFSPPPPPPPPLRILTSRGFFRETFVRLVLPSLGSPAHQNILPKNMGVAEKEAPPTSLEVPLLQSRMLITSDFFKEEFGPRYQPTTTGCFPPSPDICTLCNPESY